MIDLFDTSTADWGLLGFADEPWRVVIDLSTILDHLCVAGTSHIDQNATVHETALVSNSFIGAGAAIYEQVVVRDSVILGDTTIGHASEVARSVVLSGCMLPRFNYVGSSLLGQRVRLGGATMLASERHDLGNVTLTLPDGREVATSTHKYGSLIGDDGHVAYGCHINPGSVIGARTLLMPHTDWSGTLGSDQMVVSRAQRTITRRRVQRPGPPG